MATAQIITAAGGKQGSTGNLRRGADALGVTSYENLASLRRIVEDWHSELYEAHAQELRKEGLIK